MKRRPQHDPGACPCAGQGRQPNNVPQGLATRLRITRRDLIVSGGEIFGWTVMAIGAVAGIAFLDFIQRNLPDALDDPSCDFSDADSRTASLRNALDDGGRTPAKMGGGEATSARGLSVMGSQTGVQTQINSQSNNSHSTSPANCAGHGAK